MLSPISWLRITGLDIKQKVNTLLNCKGKLHRVRGQERNSLSQIKFKLSDSSPRPLPWGNNESCMRLLFRLCLDYLLAAYLLSHLCRTLKHKDSLLHSQNSKMWESFRILWDRCWRIRPGRRPAEPAQAKSNQVVQLSLWGWETFRANFIESALWARLEVRSASDLLIHWEWAFLSFQGTSFIKESLFLNDQFRNLITWNKWSDWNTHAFQA